MMIGTIVKCLKLIGIVKKQGSDPEYTWFKLVEWLQVEYVQIFGSYMHHQPWYQFPFGGMIQVNNILPFTLKFTNYCFLIIEIFFHIVQRNQHCL